MTFAAESKVSLGRWLNDIHSSLHAFVTGGPGNWSSLPDEKSSSHNGYSQPTIFPPRHVKKRPYYIRAYLTGRFFLKAGYAINPYWDVMGVWSCLRPFSGWSCQGRGIVRVPKKEARQQICPNPSLPKSSKYLLRRSLDPLKAFLGGVWGSKHLLTRCLED